MRSGSVCLVVAMAAVSVPRLAAADDAAATVTRSAEAERRHLVYAEGGGKFGIYGVGYEFAVADWISVGVAGGAVAAGSRTSVSASLYVGVGAAFAGRHRWFVQAGPQVVRDSEPAVPGFPGLSEVGVGAQLSAGYEYRGSRWLIRGHGVMTVGKGGVAPWAGMSVGVRL